MKRNTVNFVIDAIGYAGFVFLATTGVLIRYVLPPGSGHHTTLWGLDRHEWGGVHFWIAVVFLAVLALHVILHWRWIVCVIRGRPREGSGMRLGLGLVGALAIVAVALAPLGGPVERAAPSGGRAAVHGADGAYDGGDRAGGEHAASGHGEGEHAVRGRMSLREVAQATGVPVADLIRRLGLPPDAPRDVGVARLGREHGFTVDDVRRAAGEAVEGE